jgi:hypothetical protein
MLYLDVLFKPSDPKYPQYKPDNIYYSNNFPNGVHEYNTQTKENSHSHVYANHIHIVVDFSVNDDQDPYLDKINYIKQQVGIADKIYVAIDNNGQIINKCGDHTRIAHECAYNPNVRGYEDIINEWTNNLQKKKLPGDQEQGILKQIDNHFYHIIMRELKILSDEYNKIIKSGDQYRNLSEWVPIKYEGYNLLGGKRKISHNFYDKYVKYKAKYLDLKKL